MMKVRQCAAVVLALVFNAQIGRAQESPIRAYLDSPPAGATVAAEFMLQGWVFNCALEGQQPYSVRVYYTGDDRLLYEARVLRRYNGLRRPDVQAAFGGACGKMSQYTGFRLDVTGIPPGTRLLAIEWADAYGARYTQRQFAVLKQED